MKLPKARCEFAVLSFCPDLRDPEATSIPVGIVGFVRLPLRLRGQAAEGLWFSALLDHPGDRLAPLLGGDELARSLLNGLSPLIDDQVLGTGMQNSPERFFRWLQEQFRNSVHVSAVLQAAITSREPESALMGLARRHALGPFEVAQNARPDNRNRIPGVLFKTRGVSLAEANA